MENGVDTWHGWDPINAYANLINNTKKRQTIFLVWQGYSTLWLAELLTALA